MYYPLPISGKIVSSPVIVLIGSRLPNSKISFAAVEEAVGAFDRVVRILHHHWHGSSDAALRDHALRVVVDVGLAPFVLAPTIVERAVETVVPDVAGAIIASAIEASARVAGAIAAIAARRLSANGASGIGHGTADASEQSQSRHKCP